VAIGHQAGNDNQGPNSIIINATGGAVNNKDASNTIIIRSGPSMASFSAFNNDSCYVSPIRRKTITGDVVQNRLYYNSSNFEIYYTTNP